MLSMRVDPLRTMDELVAEFGDVVELKVPGDTFLLVAAADAAEQLLKPPDPERMRKGHAIQRVKRVLGNGLLTADGPGYLRRRRLAQPAFQPRTLDAYVPTTVEHVSQLVGSLTSGDVLDVEQAMDRLTLRIAGHTMFGVELGEERERRIHEALGVVRASFVPGLHPLAPMLEHLPLPIVRRFERAKADLVEIVDWIIAQRHADPKAAERTDVLSLLLGSKDADGTGLSDTELRDEAMVLLLAGHETTANALAWTSYLLAATPHAQAELQAQVDAVLADAEAPDASHVPQLTYARAAFTEALRLYPSGSVVARRSLDPLDMTWTDPDGSPRRMHVRAGTEIMMSQWNVQRDVRTWGEDAAVYRPERMLDQANEARHRHSFLAFGGGRRVCIGRAFATQQATITLAMLARRFRFELQPGMELPSRDRVETGFILRPRDGMHLVVRER
ncbi:MAG: cytochrome [Thermoleophilia bacterium]|nr:cytochrome [Thermoleophilia bacterium]